MSDFFMSNQDKNELQSAAQIRNDIQKKDQEDIEAFKQKKQERLENWNRYGVDVPDEYYNVFNQIISKAPTPEEAQEEAYKIGSAVKYSRMMNMPLEEAYKNVDSFNEAMFTDLQGQKSRYEALSDMFTLGTNNVKLGRLGQELMQAHGRNDTELANKLMAEIDALNQQNVLMQDNAPRTWVMEALEAGAQSLPFTGVVAGAGIIGNFIAPAVGTGASFAASSYLASGQEYIDMIANGASPETARLVATVSGGVQGLIEADLGISKSIVKGTARIIGKEAAEKAAKKSVEEIGRKVFKRFHFGAGKKVLINYLENRGKDILGEGTEEFLQEITSIVGQEVAAGLDGYDIPDDDINSIVKQTTEAFRGGVLGALSMGFIPAGINAAADVKEYKLIKDTAEAFESEEMFKEAAKDSPVFEGMSDEQKAQTIHDVWQNAQNRKEEAANIEAQKIAEGRDAAEGAEEAPAENEDGTTEANPVARDEAGRLYTSDDVSMDDNGNVTGGTFVIGDKTKSEANRYGYINYKTDENGDITIENFKMTEGREGLRAEAFDDFARQHPDVRIDWNAIGSDMQEQKQALIDANPSGAKNGLNYYSTADLDNIQARKRVAEELRKNIHNVKRNADGSYTQTELSNKQIAAGITLIESAARRMNMGLNEYINKTFGSQIFGSREEFAEASLAQGEDVNKKAGGMYQGVAQSNWREVGQQIKAVIYAGEHADFSTWAHEMAHVFQNQLDGQLKTDAEAAFNVQNGDWINSTYTFKDGRTMSSAEAFAYGFQDWLETGKAENEQMRNIFQKFAEFIADCYNRLKNHLDFTPEIESVFNQLLDGDDTIMSKALKAAQEQDNEYRASLKRQAEEKQAAKEAEKEEAKKQAEAAREEASEGTDFENTQEEQSTEEIESKLDEVTNETEKTDNAIDNALENTNLTDEKKAEIADVLKDETTTRVEKSEAVTEAASSVYNDESEIDGYPDLMFQLAGEPSIRRMAEKEERERILTELDAAQLLDEKYKSMDANSRAARIRRATGWEKDAKGEWKYEFDDSVNRIKTEFFKNNPGVLSGTPYLLNLGDILEADELYRVFPYMKNVRVSFYSDPNAFRAVLTPQGIKVNTRYLQGMEGETGLKGVLAHEIQHIIQAMEFADSKGLQGADIEQLYNDVMKAMQAAGERKYNYDLTSLQQGLDAYMQDAGEIEARNVARRIMMNADQRRMNTLASTEDVKRRGLLFQEVAGAGEAINKDNYFKNTYAQWKSASEKDLPKETPDYESDSGSEYWYTDKGVYRRSNHWGKVASCYWYLNDEVKQTGTTKEIGYTDFSDIQKMEYADDREREIARIRRINYTKYIEDPEAATQTYLDLLKKSAAERLENAEKNNNAFGAEQAKQDIELYDSINLEDVKNFKVPEWDSEEERTRLLFQIAGEIGAENLDNSEVQEGVSRMQNLAIAKQMDAEKKDAQAIRLATGWEKGADGKWRWEIDDSKVHFDLYSAMEEWDNEHPRYKELLKKFFESELSEEEQEEFDKWVDERNYIQDKHTDLSFAEKLYGKDFRLPEVMNHPELFKAYPELKEITVSIKEQTGTAKGDANYEDKHINLYRLKEDMRGFEEWEKEAGSVLLHEVQHIIQGIEGFAEGGNEEQFTPISTEKLEERLKEINNEQINVMSKYIPTEDWIAIDKELREKNLSNEEYKEARIDAISKYDNGEYRNLSQEADEIRERIEEIKENAIEGQVELSDGRMYADEFEAYRSLSGEVEARNVQTRINFTPEERREALLAATEDVAREDQIILFQQVFHGSPHNFENFSTKNIGTGEGAQAFGWGLYFTNQEAIARFYADKLSNEPKRISLISKNEYLKSRKKSLRDVENKDKYEARILKNINHFKKELKQAQKAGDENDIKFYEGLIDDSYKQLDEKERLSLVEAFKKDIANAEQEIKELKASMKNNRNLYTVEIPDDGYLQWDKNISIENIEGIKTALKDRGITDFTRLDNLMENQEKWKDNPNATYTFGSNIYKVISDYLGGDKNASLFLKDLGYIGIDYPANSIAGKSVEGERNYVIFDEANVNIKNHLLYQTVYHGSGADFDKFDTENFGLSGEGSMSFGYGTYVTDDEEIARDYAERQRNNNLSKESINPYERNTLEYEMFEDLRQDSFNFSKPLYKKYLEQEAENIKKEPNNPYQDFKANEKLALLDNFDLGADFSKTHLYTVDIPDNGYIVWDKDVDAKTKKFVEDAVFEKLTTEPNEDGEYVYKGAERELREELNSTFGADIDGEALYNDVVVYLGDEKAASKFLNKLGFVGINYPAYSNFGNAMGKSARNFVIFNDDDAQIVNKLLFQTNAELMKEAQDFESWQEFMEYCETFHADDEVSPIPSDADAQWYQTFWETSNGVKTEIEKNQEKLEANTRKETQLPMAVDALFATYIRTDPEMVDSFLQAVADIDAIDLDSEEWQQADSAEDAAQRDKIAELKDFINVTLSDYNWQTALRRIQGGHEISEGLRKRLIGEMLDNFKVRDFRALYAEVMNDEQYAVAPEDSVTAILNKKLKKYHDIVKPTDDITKWSPERRKQLAEQLQNRELADKIRRGDLKLDDELDAYIKSLTKQIKEKQKQYDDLEAETKADYQRIADKERRDLLKLHEQMLLAKGKLKKHNSDIDRKIAKGLKITKKYSEYTQNMNANYDEIFRKYSDLRNSITINAEIQAALDRQEQVAELREDLNSKQKEKNLTAEVKKMRIQLVKKTMRRVPFNRIDINNAKTIIAIQRMLEPNLLGGVNRFIGIDSPYLRGVISQIVTDSDYKESIMTYLSKNTKASQAFADFKKKLIELKSIKDFDSWTAKDRKAAIRYLPKENWVRDLKLKELAKEREESIDLDIGMEEVKRTVYDEKTGEPKTYKDAEGNEHNVTETAFRLKYDDEIGRLVQDAVGADMFDKIVNMPFSEWTTEDLEALAQRIDELYTEGRDLKAAKDEARKKEAAAIRKRIEDAIKETGITINDDDTPEEKERKQKQIEKILGMSDNLKGTEAAKPKGFKAKITRLLHSYSDMNVLRFARMLDGQSEGENVRMLYRKEDDCYNAKQRSMNARAEKIYKVMQENGITEGDLAETVKFNTIGSKTEFTVDELLYFLAADKDYAEDEKKLAKGEIGLDANDDYAATSRNAVMFGNMMSDMMSQEEKESWLQLDKDMEEALQNDTLTQEQKEQLATGQLDKKPGTTRYIAACHAKWGAILGLANSFLNQNPKFKALMEAIEADYAEQYGRMNEVSINEFNMPVHRVKAYVPLVRRESNGDTNENKVKEDLLGAAGVGKQWADRGMTQRRVNISPLNQKPVQTGLFRTWADSIERTEHFIAYAPYVRQLNAVYKSRDASYTRRFIESRYGAGAIKYLDEYINEVANPNAGRIRERGAEWLHVLRGKTAPAYLGWKASAIIKQGLTSPWPYMQFVNPAEYMAAAMKFTFNPEMREAIKEKSVFMKMRRMDPVNDLIDEMADNAKTKLDRGWSNFSKLGMQGLEMIDWACVAPGWLACYEKKYNQLQNASNARYEAKMAELKERNIYAEVGTSEYLTPQQMEAEARKEMAEDIEAEAVRYADDCTRQCQPSNRVTDLAPLFKNSSEAMKAFLQFQTSLNVIWQNLRYDMPYAVKNKEFTRIAGTVIGYVCAGIFMNSVMDGIGGDDDDDDTQALRNLIYYSTTQFTDAIPIMGSEITNTMDQLITGKRGFISSGTDMTPSATKLLSVLTTAKKGNWQKAAELTAEGIGLYLGAPVSGVKEINKLLGKPLKEGEVNIARGIGDVYGIAGDILEE